MKVNINQPSKFNSIEIRIALEDLEDLRNFVGMLYFSEHYIGEHGMHSMMNLHINLKEIKKNYDF